MAVRERTALVSRLCALALLAACGGAALAQAPVEERAVRQSPAVSAQLRAEQARREQAEAGQSLRFAEQDFAEAQRRERAAEQQLAEARRAREAAARRLEDAQSAKRRADEALVRSEAEVARHWGGKP